jgi:hypothetical protein
LAFTFGKEPEYSQVGKLIGLMAAVSGKYCSPEHACPASELKTRANIYLRTGKLRKKSLEMTGTAGGGINQTASEAVNVTASKERNQAVEEWI